MFLVIGIGNPLRQDDGIGHQVIQRLGHIQVLRPLMNLIDTHQLTPELVEPISQADMVIFVDAWKWILPGFIRRQPVYPDFRAGYHQAAFTHTITPETLLLQAWRMYGVAPQTFMYTVCGQNFDYGEYLSPYVEMALPGLVRDIHKTCGRYMFNTFTEIIAEVDEEFQNDTRICYDRDAYLEPVVAVASRSR